MNGADVIVSAVPVSAYKTTGTDLPVSARFPFYIS
jgi:hypothetical protein